MPSGPQDLKHDPPLVDWQEQQSSQLVSVHEFPLAVHVAVGARVGGSVAATCKTEKEENKTIELEMKTIMDVLSHGTALISVKNLNQQTYAVNGTRSNVIGITSVR